MVRWLDCSGQMQLKWAGYALRYLTYLEWYLSFALFCSHIFNHFYVCKKKFSVLSSNLSLRQLPPERSSRDYPEVVHTRLCLEDFYHFINLPNRTNSPNCNSYSGNRDPTVKQSVAQNGNFFKNVFYKKYVKFSINIMSKIVFLKILCPSLKKRHFM